MLVIAASASAQHVAQAQRIAPAQPLVPAQRIAPELEQALRAAAPGEQVRAYLVMSSQLSPRQLAPLAPLAPLARGVSRTAQRQSVAQALRAHAATTQAAARAVLAQAVAQGAASHVDVLWMGNAILFSAQPAVIERLAQLPGVDRLRLIVAQDPSAYQDAPAPQPAAQPQPGPQPAPAPKMAPPPLAGPEPNLVQLQAPQLWAAGFDGSGVLIGTLDSGVWWPHPDLVNRVWINPGEIAGNAIDDDHNGFVDDVRGWDFLNGTPDVTSTDNHGTQTAGIAVGDGSSGLRTTGMAPGAKLLVCEVGDESQYWLGQQYCLAMGVDVITSSYSYKWANVPKPDYHMHRQLCTVELAAGIAHANSIGNQGNFVVSYPVPFNIATPGNCPSPFDHPSLANGGRASVLGCGAIFLNDTPYSGSGIGPAAWENITLYSPTYPWGQNPAWFDYPYGGFAGLGPGLIKPDLVAYTNVWTSNIGTSYLQFTGTSASTPHLGGALALLLDSQPHAQPRHLDAALELTAQDMGLPGKDNVFGSGKLAVFSAARRLRLLGHVDDQTPALGGGFTLSIDATPNTVAQGWVSANLLLGPNDFNLGLPFLTLGVFSLGPTGHIDVPVSVPNLPILTGLTVWFQFGAGNDDFATWGPGPRISVPESITIGG